MSEQWKGFIFITGAGSGIGEAATLELVKDGYHVIAGSFPDMAEGEKLKEKAPESITPMLINVMDEESISEASAKIKCMVGGEKGLQGVVNCAGVVMLSPTEHMTVSESRTILEINLIGTFAVCRSLLALLRKTRGTIVNISSDGGILSMPYGAGYCASKFGVEALSDALRAELRPQGIRVVIVEPGNIDTPLWDKSADAVRQKYDSVPDEQKRLYEKAYNSLIAIERQGIPAQRVGKKIHTALTAKSPKARYRVGPDAHFSKMVSKLPIWLRDRLALKIMESYAK